MPEYPIQFSGTTVTIIYEEEEVYRFLAFLFADVHCCTGGVPATRLIFARQDDGQYTLSINEERRYTGRLGVQCAAILFDLVIFNLLKDNSSGVAVHAGAVVAQEQNKDRVILLPGASGSGKSNLSAWLTAQGHSYLTDELVFFPTEQPEQLLPFTRPFCIKSAAVEVINKLLPHNPPFSPLQDEQGAVVPHRALNPLYTGISAPPGLILFPTYTAETTLHIEKISGARAASLLMACHVNARNLSGHGFQQVVQLARSTPAYRLSYSSFAGLKDALDNLMSSLQSS